MSGPAKGMPGGRDLADPTVRDVVGEALNSQRAFEEQRATLLGRGAEAVSGPFGRLLSALISAKTLKAVLDAADGAAGLTLPASLTRHDRGDLAACEGAALDIQRWAQGMSAATGGAAGLFGAAGLAADIPTTIGLAARTVRATAVAYGFEADVAEEKAFRLMVLEVATLQAGDRRRDAIGRLKRAAAVLSSPQGRYATEIAGDWVSEKVVDRIARQLGVSLAGRKAGQIAPLVGGVVAAAVNASFQADVARAARFAYRERWLSAQRLLPAPAGTIPPAGGPRHG